MPDKDATLWIDRARHPLDDLESPHGAAYLAACQAAIRERGACALPDFVAPEVCARFAAEIEPNLGLTKPTRNRRTIYLTHGEDPRFPATHPRNVLFDMQLDVLPYDDIPEDAGVKAFYEWDPFAAFVARIFDLPTVHRFRGGQYKGLVINIMKEGDEQPWHYDNSDFVVTLLLQNCERGGEFEYAPFVRDATDEHYGTVADIIAGRFEGLHSIPRTPGTLLCFKGSDSLHRVTRVEGPTPRMMAIFSFVADANAKHGRAWEERQQLAS